MCKFQNDAFGNHRIYDGQGPLVDPTDNTHPANLNPYRYRGFYYDPQSNFYYLKTRYYDPTTGRFISADNIETAVTAQQFLPNGLNLYLYCFNDPINAKDENGDMPEWLKNTLFIAAAVVVVAALVVGAVVTDVTLFVALTVVTFGTTGIVAGIAGGALMGD